MTPEKYRSLSSAKPGRYGRNKRTEVGGLKFDSEGEYSRWVALNGFLSRGDITELERQVEFPFEHNSCTICTYKADFTYVVDGKLVVEDYKGNIVTPEFKIKKKLMKAFYGIDVRIVTSAKADIR